MDLKGKKLKIVVTIHFPDIHQNKQGKELSHLPLGWEKNVFLQRKTDDLARRRDENKKSRKVSKIDATSTKRLQINCGDGDEKERLKVLAWRISSMKQAEMRS